MRALIILAVAASLACATGAAAGRSGAQARQPAATPATSALRDALVQARAQSARARERAAQLDRQARSATLASERALLAAAALATRVQQAEASLASADARLLLVRRERAVLDAWLARERAPIARLVGGLQGLVRRPAVLALIQPGSIADAVHLRAVIATVAPQIESRTAALRGLLERTRALETQAAGLAAQRRRLQADLLARSNELAAVSAAQRLTARRAAGAADREAERAYAIGEEARDLSTLVRRLKAVPSGGAGPVPRPYPGAPRTGAPTNRLADYRLPVVGGIAPAAAVSSRGLTLLPRPGALVVAPAAGRVAFAGPYRGYGTIVIVEHAGGWTSLVTGLASARVAVGQTLVAGSALGLAPARGPRIGLDLRRGGQRVNPLDQLR